MKKYTGFLLYTFVFAVFFIASGCREKSQPEQGAWIKGSEREKIKKIEKQFRGFDHAMVETGYRYQELYWAGQDENWEYADYQIEKIRVAIENGLERRPKRAKSAEHFLSFALPEMQKSVSERDTAVFKRGFEMLTTQCNNCHAKEKMPFFSVKPPNKRQSPIQK
ncbi:MAG: hypothetical protein JJU02_10350 [Cryomorphaceae bacterium]|nr:hypothetical protein [Cryomorphaceae bacterium]